MKIRIAKSAGFCFGVKRAIKIAEQIAFQGKPIDILGDIVHNQDVANRMSRLGLRKIKRLGKGSGRILLIRAHGISKKIKDKAKLLGYKLVDATCPMVKEIHSIAKKEEKQGRKIIIIGDSNHAEVLGIIGQLKGKAMVLDLKQKINWNKIEKLQDKKVSVVVQSTQNLEEVDKLKDILKEKIKDLKFINTICGPTRLKQKEIQQLPKTNDIVIVIGSKRSANTKRLYEISKAINSRTYWVENKKEIRKNWFKKINSVGITAGASTPANVIQEVVKEIKKIRSSLNK